MKPSFYFQKSQKKKKGAKETKESKRKDTIVTCAKSIYLKVELELELKKYIYT